MKVFIASVGHKVFELEEQDAYRTIFLMSIRAEIDRIRAQHPYIVVVGSQYFTY